MKSKRQPSTTLLSGEVVRHLDEWRKFAAIPFLPISISCVGVPATWTLKQDGKLVSQWQESDAPGLGNWLQNIVAQYHGAWHLARTELGVVTKKRRGGTNSGVVRSGKGSKAEKVRGEIARHVDAGRDPTELVANIAKAAGCSQAYVRKILRTPEK